MAQQQLVRHRMPHRHLGTHRRKRWMRRAVTVVRKANVWELASQLWAHTEMCPRCDQHGLCSAGQRLVLSVNRADRQLCMEVAVAA